MATKLLGLAALLKGRFNIPYIILGTLLPRFQAASEAKSKWYLLTEHQAEEYRQWAGQVNDRLLENAADIPYVKVWRYTQFTDQRRYLSGADDIHLSKQGLYHLYKSLRGAIITGTAMVRPIASAR